jgi:hypothetical protein
VGEPFEVNFRHRLFESKGGNRTKRRRIPRLAGQQCPEVVEAERDYERADQHHQPFGRDAGRDERA